MTDPAPVMDAAAVFLSVRPRSVAETRGRLRNLGYAYALVDAVVERLIEMNYLNDAEFARAWVESRDRVRPRGEAALRRELALKGVARPEIDAALTERAEQSAGNNPNASAAAALLERRRSSLQRESDPVKRRHKAFALLARNGFDPETAREAASSFKIE